MDDHQSELFVVQAEFQLGIVKKRIVIIQMVDKKGNFRVVDVVIRKSRYSYPL